MDTDRENCIIVHLKEGFYIKFTASGKGLCQCELKDNNIIHKLWKLVTTVQDKADKNSKQDCSRAIQAQKLQNVIMQPNTHKLWLFKTRNLELNFSFPVLLHKNFGCNLQYFWHKQPLISVCVFSHFTFPVLLHINFGTSATVLTQTTINQCLCIFSICVHQKFSSMASSREVQKGEGKCSKSGQTQTKSMIK